MEFYVIADIDECDLGTATCSQICYNTEGSYTCSCHEGYYLHTDARTCMGKIFTILKIATPGVSYLSDKEFLDLSIG